MRTNTARLSEHTEHLRYNAQIIEMHQPQKLPLPKSTSPDFEAFLSYYGEGVASDFA